jgi:hypothetical protein
VIRLALRIHRDESGLTGLEKLGVVAIIISFLAFIPAARGLVGDIYTKLFKSVDESGATTTFSTAARGILVAITSIVAFVGSGFLLVYTNLGKRLGMLVTGAALFGWLTIGSMLFVVYAPRGLRPSSVVGLGSIEIRIPAIGLAVASLILFVMFVVALDKYEKESDI